MFLHCLYQGHLLIFCCRLETIIFKLEVLDHKARERAGVITPTLGSPIPVLLSFDAAVEVNITLPLAVFTKFMNL